MPPFGKGNKKMKQQTKQIKSGMPEKFREFFYSLQQQDKDNWRLYLDIYLVASDTIDDINDAMHKDPDRFDKENRY